MPNKIILLLLLFMANSVSSQQLLKGKLVSDRLGVESILVVNLTAGKETQTDAGGNFSIMAKTGDVLVLTAVQFREKRIRVQDFDFQQVFSVKMEAALNQLDEVVVDKKTSINPEDLGLVAKGQKVYTPAERKVKTSNSGTDAIINAITGQTRKLKKQAEIEKQEVVYEKFQYLFEDEFYIEKLHIPAEYIAGFKHFCIEDQEFVRVLKANNKNMMIFLMGGLADKYNTIRTVGN
ncbi:hypothetical protein [Flavobacterium kingsejongi]|uniref:TonB-dependent receptor n=1 Tax=Flavobacterium kingsejongi TaxID=1678728 RepID=A0A2S1LJS2_9FLAO|nr:hypothetical protein [Flavobacterium kingsejongi]AWG23949.1 hypothetical protein FK004_01280 [Flavobacterium kingsejongi]